MVRSTTGKAGGYVKFPARPCGPEILPRPAAPAWSATFFPLEISVKCFRLAGDVQLQPPVALQCGQNLHGCGDFHARSTALNRSDSSAKIVATC